MRYPFVFAELATQVFVAIVIIILLIHVVSSVLSALVFRKFSLFAVRIFKSKEKVNLFIDSGFVCVTFNTIHKSRCTAFPV